MRAAYVLMIAAAACGADEPRCAGGYHVCDGSLRDPEGRALVLRGVNLATSHKQAPYTDPFGPADYARLRTWGFNAIRYVVPWAAIEPAPGAYDDAYLDYIAERAGWAHDAGLLVIVDMHQDVYGEGFGYDGAPRWTCDEARYAAFVPRDPWPLNYADPNVLACFDHLWTDRELQGQFSAAWKHVAERLSDQPAVIGFDPLNEPQWGTAPVASFERELLQPFYSDVIRQVRSVAPWVAFVEPAASRNLGLATHLQPFDEADVVYAPHLYDSMAETGAGFDPARRDLLLGVGGELRAEADQLGAALWIGEYGGQGSDPQIGAYMDAAYDSAAAGFASSMLWSFDRGGGYGLLDEQGNEVAPLVDAVARPYPARVAGDPISWDYDDASRALHVSWRPDPAVTAPTVIVVPARVYPTGVTVDCGGCEALQVDGELRLSAPPGDPATITVLPAS
ncbi:MAG: glycoside hydrolase family 5 protein [Deltaproteobacteria bacterium]|nr:glycoside hydrolase family 5 protein [Deltaproteobacteria bacterium]